MSIISFITELSNINKEKNVFSTPRYIDEDSQYLSKLSDAYEKIEEIATKNSLSEINQEIKNIEKAVEKYYDGQIDGALRIIRNIIKEFNDVPYICTKFNNCGAFNNLRTDKVDDKDID